MTRLVTVIKKIKLFFACKNRFIYVVLKGTLKGEWLVKIEENSEHIIFFSLPDKHIRNIKKTDFKWGLANKVLETVDVLPKCVYNVCLAEYNLKKTDVNLNNTLNRREQHPTSHTLGSE